MSTVLHLVTRLRPGGHGGTLWPTLMALADGQLIQQVLPLAAGAGALQAARLLSPESVQLLPVPAMRAVATALRRVLDAPAPPQALHLHGLPALLSARHVLQGRPRAAPMPLFLHQCSRVLAQRLLQGMPERSVFLVGPDRVDPLAAAPLPGAVDAAFFSQPLIADTVPRIVTAATGDLQADEEIAQAFAELAVMLSGIQAARQPTFAWIGPVPGSVRALLLAAQVKLQDIALAQAPARARALAQAWIYLAPDVAGRGADRLAEAMAVGLACVAAPAPSYRLQIIDALSGELHARRADLLQALARLLESDALRLAMGRAARLRARHQHGHHRFRASLLLAHGLSPLPVLRHEAGHAAPAMPGAPASPS
ncbi:glycosyltransferase [Sphaerotilus natans]|uniref:glycosyltransferase n=1 Tax=Sphaerotilus natans TaxID=34103 RepID=UPI00406CDE38